MVSSTYCVVCLLCFPPIGYPLLSVSLDCPVFNAPSAFSNVYLLDICIIDNLQFLNTVHTHKTKAILPQA